MPRIQVLTQALKGCDCTCAALNQRLPAAAQVVRWEYQCHTSQMLYPKLTDLGGTCSVSGHRLADVGNNADGHVGFTLQMQMNSKFHTASVTCSLHAVHALHLELVVTGLCLQRMRIVLHIGAKNSHSFCCQCSCTSGRQAASDITGACSPSLSSQPQVKPQSSSA